MLSLNLAISVAAALTNDRYKKLFIVPAQLFDCVEWENGGDALIRDLRTECILDVLFKRLFRYRLYYVHALSISYYNVLNG